MHVISEFIGILRPAEGLRSVRWYSKNAVQPVSVQLDSPLPVCSSLAYLDLTGSIAGLFVRKANTSDLVVAPSLESLRIASSNLTKYDLSQFLWDRGAIARVSVEKCTAIDIVGALAILHATTPQLSSLRTVRRQEEIQAGMLPVPIGGFTFPALQKLSIENEDLGSDVDNHASSSEAADLVKRILAPRLTHFNMHFQLAEVSVPKFRELLAHLGERGIFPVLSTIVGRGLEGINDDSTLDIKENKDDIAQVKEKCRWTSANWEVVREVFGAGSMAI